MYTVGSTYSRNDIYNLLSIPEVERGGDWLNGYHRHGSDYYIFCNIGVPGRTGHDYENYWEGDKLVWHGKGQSHFAQPVIRNLLSGDYRVFVFYRYNDRAPFTFAGVGTPIPHFSIERPVGIDWTFSSDDTTQVSVYTDEVVPGANFQEGQRTQVFVNRYERDRGARDACIRHYGASCIACGVNFGALYGELGEGFIHVHHVVPVSEIGQTYVVDPVRDLVPVCPNCHAILHRRNPPLTIEELKSML